MLSSTWLIPQILMVSRLGWAEARRQEPGINVGRDRDWPSNPLTITSQGLHWQGVGVLWVTDRDLTSELQWGAGILTTRLNTCSSGHLLFFCTLGRRCSHVRNNRVYVTSIPGISLDWWLFQSESKFLQDEPSSNWLLIAQWTGGQLITFHVIFSIIAAVYESLSLWVFEFEAFWMAMVRKSMNSTYRFMQEDSQNLRGIVSQSFTWFASQSC